MPTAEDRFLRILTHLRGIAFGENPMQARRLSVSQVALLDWVAANPGAGIGEIAAGLGLTAPTVSVAVSQLSRRGLLERVPDPDDGRAVRVTLSPRGSQLQQQAREFRCRKVRRLLKALSPDEQETLFALLERAIAGAAHGPKGDDKPEHTVGGER